MLDLVLKTINRLETSYNQRTVPEPRGREMMSFCRRILHTWKTIETTSKLKRGRNAENRRKDEEKILRWLCLSSGRWRNEVEEWILELYVTSENMWPNQSAFNSGIVHEYNQREEVTIVHRHIDYLYFHCLTKSVSFLCQLSEARHFVYFVMRFIHSWLHADNLPNKRFWFQIYFTTTL